MVRIKTSQYDLEMGWAMTKVHRKKALQQRAWLKPWIDFHTGTRKDAKRHFAKGLLRFIKDAVYDKRVEDKRNRMDFELVDNEV